MAYPDKPKDSYSLRDYDFAQADSKKIPMTEYLFKNGYKNAEESETESVPDAHEQNWLFDLFHRNIKYAIDTAEENKKLIAENTDKIVVVDEKLKDVVHTTGNETIDGTKTFTSDLIISKPKSTNLLGVTCKTTGFKYSDSTTTQVGGARLVSYDNDGNYWGFFQTLVNSSNVFTSSMGIRRNVNNVDKAGSISIYSDANGNVYTAAPTPTTGDNSTKIATTAFVQNSRGLIFPNYSSAVSIASGYITPSAGWVWWRHNQESTAQLLINGIEVGVRTHYKYGSSSAYLFPVRANSTITFTNTMGAKFFRI